MSPIKLPDDLELQALTRFDTLVSQGNLFYEETQGEIAEDKGFKFEFRISQALSKKPILTHDAPERRGVGGPFLHPDPAFVVSHVGHRHILELNMHCIHRPMYILHTREFVSQDDDLDLDDLSAVHAVMANLGRKVPQMAIYNCGAEAGASQGHKHLQIFASPSPFPLFPEQVQSTQDIATRISGIPYQHFVLRLPERCQARYVFQCYAQLLSVMRTAQDKSREIRAYNVCLTNSWICLIPRRHGRLEGVGTNAAGMLGLVWLGSQAEREAWDKLGPLHHLERLGVDIASPGV